MATRRKTGIERAIAPLVITPALAALERLAGLPCMHPPACGHQRFSECRNALAAAIKGERDKAQGNEGEK